MTQHSAQRGRKSVASMEVYDLIGNRVDTRHRPTVNLPQPPAHLGPSEKLIWASVFADYTLESGVSVAMLQSALEAHQRARLAREAIAKEGMTVAAAMARSNLTPC
jgi:hypothetical protein